LPRNFRDREKVTFSQKRVKGEMLIFSCAEDGNPHPRHLTQIIQTSYVNRRYLAKSKNYPNLATVFLSARVFWHYRRKKLWDDSNYFDSFSN